MFPGDGSQPVFKFRVGRRGSTPIFGRFNRQNERTLRALAVKPCPLLSMDAYNYVGVIKDVILFILVGIITSYTTKIDEGISKTT